MIAYDLDGVLCAAPQPPVKKWGLMNAAERAERKQYLKQHCLIAPVLITPAEDEFIVITARKKELEPETVVWFKNNMHGKTVEIYFLTEARTARNVIAFKKQVVQDNKITHYTEDNKTILRGLRNLGVQLYYFDGEQQTVFK